MNSEHQKYNPDELANLLERYASGEMDAVERHALEKAALDDDALFDALEGLNKHSLSFKEAITDLSYRLRTRLNTKRERRISFIRIAAAIAILVVCLFGIWFIQKQSKEKTTAQLDPTHVESGQDKTQTSNEHVSMEESNTIEEIELKDGPVSKKPEKNITDKKSGIPVDLNETEIVISNQEEPETETPPQRQAPGKKDAIEQSENGTEEIAGKPAMEVLEDQNTRYSINGLVKDDTGEPLIGASITQQGTDLGTVTDINGKFSFDVEDTNKVLAISYVGYETAMMAPHPGRINEVSLISGVELSEVVVADYGHPKIRKTSAAMSIISYGGLVQNVQVEAYPETGFEYFENFIEDHKIYPAAAIENNISGQVVIHFQLSDIGEPTAFKIHQSPGYGCDEEAIRLIEKGPRWITEPPGQDVTISYTIDFK